LTYPQALVESKDDDGNCPLGIAAQCGFLEIVDALLQKGADVNIPNVKMRNVNNNFFRMMVIHLYIWL